MATLASLNKQIQALQKQADALRQSEKAAAIKTVRGLIGEYGLTALDVGLVGAGPKGKVKGTRVVKGSGVAKYRDPDSGKTWTGHGKAPGWIAGVADRTKFLIDGSAAAEATSVAKAPKLAKAAKKAAKPAAPAKKAAVKAAAGAKQVRAAKGSAKPAAPVKKASVARKATKAAAKKVTAAAGQAGAPVTAVAAEAA